MPNAFCPGANWPTSTLLSDLTVTPDGSIYFSCFDQVKRVNPNGTVVTVFAFSNQWDTILGLTSDAAGTVYFSARYLTSQRTVVSRLASDGTTTVLVDVTAATGDPDLRITRLAVDSSGAVYGAAGPNGLPYTCSGGTDGCFQSYPAGNLLYRLSPGLVVKIAGDGTADPATGTQTGAGSQLAVTPVGVAADGSGTCSSPRATPSTASPAPQEPVSAPPAPPRSKAVAQT